MSGVVSACRSRANCRSRPQVAVSRRGEPIEMPSKEEAERFREELGEGSVDVYLDEGSWFIRLKRGAVLSIPRALSFDRYVAGQIPTGWDAVRLGVPADIASQLTS